jgi:hypothetical protein
VADTQGYKRARLSGRYPYGGWVYVKRRKGINDYSGDTQFAGNQVYTGLKRFALRPASTGGAQQTRQCNVFDR